MKQCSRLALAHGKGTSNAAGISEKGRSPYYTYKTNPPEPVNVGAFCFITTTSPFGNYTSCTNPASI